MNKIEKEKLENITGGGSITAAGIVVLAISAVSVLISGIFQGYTHPRGCNEKA